MHSATCLTLGCSCGNSLYEVFLEHTEDDQRRHDGDYGSCKYDIPSGSILSYEGCDLNGNGLRFAAGKCQVRHQVIIPDSQTVQDHHGSCTGSEKREGNLPEGLERSTSVNLCRFLDLQRDACNITGYRRQ